MTLSKTGHAVHIAGQLRGRWNENWNPEADRFKKQHYAFARALRLVEDVDAKSTEMAKDRKYSAEGRTQIMRDWLAANVVKQVRQASSYALMAREELKLELASLNTFRATPGDIVGAIRRNEIRTWLRSLDVGAVLQVLSAKDTPSEVYDALFDSPTPLSGIAAIEWDNFLPRMLAGKYPEKIAEIEAANEAAKVAEVALDIAKQEVKRTAGFEQQNEFVQWYEAA